MHPRTDNGSLPWLVQKFGGTSLGKMLDTICRKIIPSYSKTFNLAIVCSAFSGSTKANGTTSLLMQCIDLAEGGPSHQSALHQAMDLIKENHHKLIDKYFLKLSHTQRDLYESTVAKVFDECENLLQFLLAAQVSVFPLHPRLLLTELQVHNCI